MQFALIPPFAPMDAAAAIHVAQLAEIADVIVVGPVPFGHGNIDNLLVAVRAGRPVVLVGDISHRDFAGGAAAAYRAEALGAGARVVETPDDVERALDDILPPR